MANNKFKVMKAQAEILERIDALLDDIIKDVSYRYEAVGKEEEQATNWNNELMWEDDEHTIPHYRNKYEHVPIPENEMDETDRIKRDVCRRFSERLDKLIG